MSYYFIIQDLSLAGSGRPSKVTSEVLRIVESQMQKDDETTAIQLQKILVDEGYPLSLKTILKSRNMLGWTFCGSAYCQIIREANKTKRLQWATDNLEEFQQNGFDNVLFGKPQKILLQEEGSTSQAKAKVSW